MRRPEDDVFLRDGEGHMSGREPYRTHIKTTTEHFQVSFKFNIYFCTHICFVRNPAAATIERSMVETRMAKTVIPLESVDAHAHVMEHLCLTAWLISRREKGWYNGMNPISTTLTGTL